MDLNQFFEELSSSQPVPGGGSAACVAAAMGVSLMEMVTRLSIGRGRETTVEKRLATLLNDVEKIKEDLFILAEEDAKSYRAVMEAFKLPKETEEDKNRRKQAIQKALEGAIASPLTLMERINELLVWNAFLLDEGNQNAFSDAGVAFHLLTVAYEGGKMNVGINLGSLNNTSLKRQVAEKVEDLDRVFYEIKGKIVEKIEKWMRPALS